MLGNVLLTKEDVFKPVKVISGGERAKLALCILMLEKSNVMLLDEPTNHLDLPSKEILEEALLEYGGTLLFISHDRYLLNRLPDKIIEMNEDGLTVYDGNYDAYVERKKFLASMAVQEESAEKAKQKPQSGSYRTKEQRRQDAERKARLRTIESEIERLEEEIDLLQGEISREEIYTDYQLLTEKTSKIEENQQALDGYYEEWEILQEDV